MILHSESTKSFKTLLCLTLRSLFDRGVSLAVVVPLPISYSCLYDPSCPQYNHNWRPRIPFNTRARANPAATRGSPTSIAVVKSLAKQPTTCDATANTESWPVDSERWFCRICGNFENRERGKVQICKKANSVMGITANASAEVDIASDAVTRSLFFVIKRGV